MRNTHTATNLEVTKLGESLTTGRLFAKLQYVSVDHASGMSTYERFDPGVRSSVNLQVSLLVEALVAVGHAALVSFSWLWTRLRLFLLHFMSVLRW